MTIGRLIGLGMVLGALLTGTCGALAGDPAPFVSPGAQWPETYLESPGLDLQRLRSEPAEETPPSYDLPPNVSFSATGDGTSPLDPVILVAHNGETRAYPMRIVATHRIVNDRLGGSSIAVTYCRVCAAPMVFLAEVDGEPTHIGLTGLSHDENIVLYDTASRTWWQQINGFGLAGPHSDGSLTVLPSRLVSWASLQRKSENGEEITVILPSDHANDDLAYREAIDYVDAAGRGGGLSPTDRVIVIGNDAWPLAQVQEEGRIVQDDLVLEWHSGRLAGPDAFGRDEGRDVGMVEAYRLSGDSALDVDTRVQLLHAFLRFNEKGRLQLRSDGHILDK